MEFEIPETLRCRKCGTTFIEYLSADLVADEDLMKTYREYSYCTGCRLALRLQAELEQQKREAAKRQAELDEQYSARLKASNLDTYRLDYDPAKGNRELENFIEHNQHECLWIAGKTGLCKTRLLQHFARKMLKYQTVQFWPAMDLLSMLSDHAKDIERYLRPIYQTELLVIDDLGAECVTEARMKYLFNIIDRRTIGYDQKKHGMIGRQFGWQIWISTNDNGTNLYNNMRDYAGPCIRRLQEICKIWEKFQ